MGRGQGAVHHVLVSFFRGVGHEGVDLLGSRREAEEVHVHATHEGFLVGFGRRFDALGFELRQDKMIDRSARPGLVFDLGNGRLHRRDERPVRLVFGSLTDPIGERSDLLLGERRFFCVWRRHGLVRVFCDDALEQEAFLGFAGNDAVAGRFSRFSEIGAGVLLGIETERTGLVVRIGAVAGEAVVRQNRQHLGAEGDFIASR